MKALFTNYIYNSLGRFLLSVSLVIGGFAISPMAQAVLPAPDGGYPGGNTAEGQSALLRLTSGGYNTAVGFDSLISTTNSFNTAIGAGTLLANTADNNTAIGVGALFSNTTGSANTANGTLALFSNTDASGHTATGYHALESNTTGHSNTATGFAALANNTTGSLNVALGFEAGFNVTTATNVICIGTSVQGNNVDNSCYIGNIFGATSSNGISVFVNSNGRLGTMTSSARFKQEIEPMGRTSEALMTLNPVTFRYKKEIDPAGTLQFGLVAEEVAKVNPALVVRDEEGKPYSVRYDQVNAMLLNEFLKEHKAFVEEQRKVQQLTKDFEWKIAKQQKQIKMLTAGLQKVSAQLEVNKPAPQTVLNRQ